MALTLDALYAVVENTWPAAAAHRAGPWMLRQGAGGGQRVSAATVEDGFRSDDLIAAEDAMRMMGQHPLFMIRNGETELDAALEARGYAVKDPVNLWVCPIGQLTDTPIPPVKAYAVWEPLAVMREIWEAGGIGPGRVAVMERATCPKTGLFGRVDDKPAAAGYCGIHAGIAMVHALEVLEARRGKGLGKWMMRCAAIWAERQGADWMAVLCTKANGPANGLYAALGMKIVGDYHYRIAPKH